MNTKFFIWKVH